MGLTLYTLSYCSDEIGGRCRLLRLERHLKITPDAFASIGVEVTPIYYNKIGGQSGERSQRAAKRRIYSPNRLLNGIPTHILRYIYDSGVLSLTKRSFDLRYIGVKLVAEVGFEPTCLTL